MSVERIVWLIIGILLIVWAAVAVLTDEPTIDQEHVDAIQNVLLGVFALGLAYRSR
jgi:hypothetical protein